jgi:hypothetical protein
MTDKMPVVTLFFEDGNGNKIDYHLTTWDRIFEELPASNSQEKEEVQINENLKVTMSCANCSKDFKELDGKFQPNCRCYDSNNYVSFGSHIQKKEVSEVERALEELKNYFSNNSSNHSEILNLAQNLVNALEAEKDKSKPEPEIDMKEECVEPVSIWKDVSELPKDHLEKHGEELIGLKLIFGGKANFVTHVDILRHGKGMTLTDFIKQVEDMEARLRKLEGK